MQFFKLFFVYFPGLIAPSCSALTLDQNAEGLKTPRQLIRASGCKLKAQPSEGSYCKTTGTLKPKNEFPAAQPSYTTSFEECVDLCYRRGTPAYKNNPYYEPAACTSFKFSANTSRCYIYYESLHQMDFEPGTADSTALYSDFNACFKCPDPCENQPFNVNLLDNAGFESPLFGPWAFGNYSLVSSPGFHSQHLLRCGPVSCGIHQNLITCSQNFYRLRFEYRAIPATPSEKVLDFGDTFVVKFPGTGHKTTAEAWFQPVGPRLTQLGLNIYPNYHKKQYIEMDNFEIVRVSDAFKTLPNSREYIPNGGFESGKIAPWNTSTSGTSSFRVVSPGINSSHALRFTGLSKGSRGSLSQIFPVRDDTPYLLKFNVRKGLPTQTFPDVHFNGELMFLPASQIHGDNLAFSLPFRPVVSTVDLEFDFSGRGTTLIDNISLKRLDEAQA